MFSTMRILWEVLVLTFTALLSKAISGRCGRINKPPCAMGKEAAPVDAMSYCLSWRLAVEANNVLPWRTVPLQCMSYVENYMLGGQYERDLDVIMEQISTYLDGIVLSKDGMDAWILDVDDTCLSNLLYYKDKRFGCDPFDSTAFKKWILMGGCPAVPAVLELFRKLVSSGFKVFLLTGRDKNRFGQATLDNLHNQGYLGYERLIMRSEANKGQSVVVFKSEIRRGIEGEGYRIWGNVGDQWTDLLGDCSGTRTFKLPNPLYLIS